MLVHQSLHSLPVDITGVTCEMVWCKISLSRGEYLTVGSFYRPPSSTAQPLLSLYNALSVVAPGHVVLGGDFNLPDVSWLDHRPMIGNSSSLYATFSDIINDFHLYQFVTEPTRLGVSRASVLDILLCNRFPSITSVSVVPGISDHEAVVATMKCLNVPRYRNPPKKAYMFNRGDYDSLGFDLMDFLSDFEVYSVSNDVNTLWNIFKNKIQELVDIYVPTKMVSAKRKQDKPWMNSEIRRSINKNKRIFARYKKSNDSLISAQLKNLQKDLKVKIKKAESEYFLSLDSKLKDCPKEFWKYVKSQRKDVTGVPSLLVDDNLVTDDSVKAAAFNKYFKSVFSTFAPSSLPPTVDKVSGKMNELTLDHNGIRKLLGNIKLGKAPGPDGIPNIVLKSCADIIASYLLIIFTKSLESGRLPDDWKFGNVVPIHKNGKKNSVENYRPISLTSECCKIMEHIIYSNLISHLNINNFFSSAQHGFRTGLSCNTQLLEFYHDLACAFDKCCQTDCIFFRFQESF